MTQAARDPQTFLPLTPTEFHILLALAEGEKHGYAIEKQPGDRLLQLTGEWRGWQSPYNRWSQTLNPSLMRYNAYAAQGTIP